MFSSEKLVGYWDTNEETSTSSVSKSETGLILNKSNFNSNPKGFNCVLQQNASGFIELVSVKCISPGEQIICWLAEPYLKNIKSKLNKN